MPKERSGILTSMAHWDGPMIISRLLLLGGVALSCGTGFYLSVRWVWRKAVALSGRR